MAKYSFKNIKLKKNILHVRIYTPSILIFITVCQINSSELFKCSMAYHLPPPYTIHFQRRIDDCLTFCQKLIKFNLKKKYVTIYCSVRLQGKRIDSAHLKPCYNFLYASNSHISFYYIFTNTHTIYSSLSFTTIIFRVN